MNGTNMAENQTTKTDTIKDNPATKIKSRNFTCRILGHDWKVDSLKRTCTRCGKTQTAKFTTDLWVDVDEC